MQHGVPVDGYTNSPSPPTSGSTPIQQSYHPFAIHESRGTAVGEAGRWLYTARRKTELKAREDAEAAALKKSKRRN